jgi:hypothetical protein
MLNSAQAHDLPHGSHALIDCMSVLGLAKMLKDGGKYVDDDRDPLAATAPTPIASYITITWWGEQVKQIELASYLYWRHLRRGSTAEPDVLCWFNGVHARAVPFELATSLANRQFKTLLSVAEYAPF